MPQMPLISCVIPTFNAKRYIAQSLGSILAQTWRPIEVVIADDGSNDGTVEEAERLLKKANVPYVVARQDDKGPAATRTMGRKAAKAEWIGFLDADDLWEADKLTRQMAFMQQRGLKASVTHVQMFWETEAENERWKDHPRAKPVPGYATISLLAHKSVYEQVGDFSSDYWFADATDWFLRAREMGIEVGLMEDVLVRHRMRDDNLTTRRWQESREEFLDIVKAALDRKRARDNL